MAPAVGLDDQPKLGPVEIDAVRRSRSLRLRQGRLAARTIARNLRSRPVSVRASRPSSRRMQAMPGLGPSAGNLERRASGSTRSSRSASLIACSTRHSGAHDARSTKGRDGIGHRDRRRPRDDAPGPDRSAPMRRDARAPDETPWGMTTSDRARAESAGAKPQSAAALRWLSSASGPQASTAAIQRPAGSLRPPDRDRRPRARADAGDPSLTRCSIESGPIPSASNCARVTTPCCSAGPGSQTLRALDLEAFPHDPWGQGCNLAEFAPLGAGRRWDWRYLGLGGGRGRAWCGSRSP